jgi:large subunit ribosomal protein L25
MTTNTSLKIELREGAGTGPARAVRREQKVPAIIYGAGEPNQAVACEHKALFKEMHTAGFFTKLFTLEGAGAPVRVIVKALQLHPVTDQPLHVDFLRVNKDSRIDVAIPLHFINQEKSPGIKKGGILNIVSHVLHLVCSPDHIPEGITIDLAGLEINHSIHIDDIKLPEGAKVKTHQDSTLATIVAPSGGEKESSEA